MWIVKLVALLVAYLWFIRWVFSAFMVGLTSDNSLIATATLILLALLSSAVIWGLIYSIGRLIVRRRDRLGFKLATILGVVVWIFVLLECRLVLNVPYSDSALRLAVDVMLSGFGALIVFSFIYGISRLIAWIRHKGQPKVIVMKS